MARLWSAVAVVSLWRGSGCDGFESDYKSREE